MHDKIKNIDGLSGEEKRGILRKLLSKETTSSFYPLSYGQRAIWFMQRLIPETPAYNVSMGWQILSELNIAILNKTLQLLLDRHPALRTNYTSLADEPVQTVHSCKEIDFNIHDAADWDDQEFTHEINRVSYRMFDLENDPLMRADLFLRQPGSHVLLLSFHHIAVDLWSLVLLFEDIKILYPAVGKGRPVPTGPKYSYTDFIVWQKKMLAGPEGHHLWRYWQQELGDSTVDLELPYDFPKSARQNFTGDMYPFKFNSVLTSRIKAFAKANKTTLYPLLLAAFQTILCRYTGQDKFLIGSMTAGRNHEKFENIVGFFANPVLIKADFRNGSTFMDILKYVQKKVAGAIEHQDFPFSFLIEKLKPSRSTDYNPYSNVLFVLQSPHRFYSEQQLQKSIPDTGLFTPGRTGTRIDLGGLVVERYNPEFHITQNDLAIEMLDAGNELSGAIHYRTDLFSREKISRLATHYENIILSVLERPEGPLSKLKYLSKDEFETITHNWNNTSTEISSCKAVHQLFETQAKKTPGDTALLYKGQVLSYDELNKKTNQLARFLEKSGVRPQDTVCISMKRSPHLVIAMLATLKAGCAFLPVDDTCPDDRIQYILNDALPAFILTESHLESTFTQVEDRTLCLDTQWSKIDCFGTENLDLQADEQALAYIIYTSGSTGTPKGVMIEHRNLINMIQSFNRAYKTNNLDRVMQQTSISFDVAIGEIFPILCAGGTLCLPSAEDFENIEKRLKYINNNQITILGAAPSLLAQYNKQAEELRSVRLILSGGETLIMEDIDQLLKVTSVTNGYGPTETTICSSFCFVAPPQVPDINDESDNEGEELSFPNRIPIGKPIDNVKMYILDKNLQPLPVGISGELYIGGAGVGRGYLNNPELTDDNFIQNPFTPDTGERIYRTGDKARYLQNGDIVFLGRTDNQVKVRGFRVEIEEIEVMLCKHPQVREACVIPLRRGEHTDHLAACVVFDKDAPETIVLQDFLEKRLPHYMIPSVFMPMDRLLKTPGGKLDRNALTSQVLLQATSSPDYVAPRNHIEEQLCNVWAELLDLKRVGIYDNFFDLGGHSLLATQIVSSLQKDFSVEIPLRNIFESPTIAALAADIKTAMQSRSETPALPITPVSRDGTLPLSFSQQRLWFLDQLMPGSIAYNIPAAARMKGVLDVKALEMSLNEIVKRHEVLRTSFTVNSGKSVLHIEPKLQSEINIFDLMHLPEDRREQEADKIINEEAHHTFDLTRSPLMRTTLLKLGKNDHIIIMVIHHIISDGWSAAILLKELTEFYTAFSEGKKMTLPHLPVQYADFAVWQRQCFDDKRFDRHVEYWKKQLEGCSDVLELPTDRPRHTAQSLNGAVCSFAISKQLSGKLKELSKRQGCTLFMTLLAAFSTLLHRMTGQEDVLLGTPVANRNQKEVEDLIGFFVNTLVLRTTFAGKPSFVDLLTRVKDTCFEAYAHQDFPFEKLVEVLQPDRVSNSSPLVQVAFAFQNTPVAVLKYPGLTITPIQIDHITASLDLTLLVVEQGEKLTGFFEYKTELFDESTIHRIINRFQTVLESIVADPDQSVSLLSCLSQDEHHLLLDKWNHAHAEYPENKCLHHLFEAQASLTPDAVAVLSAAESRNIWGATCLTYGVLNCYANQLAHHLIQTGISSEVPVGLCMDSSLEMVVGILAILKAGGVYVPLDPDYPSERLAYMIQESEAPVILTQIRLLESIPAGGAKTICLDSDWEIIEKQHNTNPDCEVTSQNLAYIIFTSGSTGQPKGVLIEHKSVVNVIHSFINTYRVTAVDKVLQQASISFDVSVNEIFPVLCTGGSLIISQSSNSLDLDRLLKTLSDHEITIWGTAPSLLKRLNQTKREIPTLRLILSGGEALSFKDVDHLISFTTITNGYGPTEASICASYYTLNKSSFLTGSNVPIGKPITNCQIYVLDKNLESMPIGCPGEIFIGGVGLARGYLHDTDLTLEKFIPSPFMPDKKLFRTGDLARWLPDGNLEFLGRIDRQIKVRGFRIEPGEIETVLRQHSELEDAALIDLKNPHGEPFLAAYFVAARGSSLNEIDVRSFIEAKMPPYMIPSEFIKLESLPYLPNGKIDHQLLPRPLQLNENTANDYVAPRTIVEKKLAAIWAEVLGIDKIGIYDNFFDLGGHSLLAAQLVFNVREAFQIDLPLHLLFEMPNISAMAEELEKISKVTTTEKNKLKDFESSLVVIQSSGSKPPFFCVHPATGTALCYANLSRHLGPDQPFYGLQSPGLENNQQILTRIDDMVSHYLEAIRSIFPKGPYLLGGWSMGGLVAFEMASQFLKEGREVLLLALFDVPPLYNKELGKDKRAYFTGIFAQEFGLHIDSQAFSFDYFLTLAPEKQALYLAKHITRAESNSSGNDPLAGVRELVKISGLTLSNTDNKMLEHYLKIFSTNINACKNYIPSVYPGDLTIFRARDNSTAALPDQTYGWGKMSETKVDYHMVPGSHATIMMEPNVRDVAKQLKKSICRALM